MQTKNQLSQNHQKKESGRRAVNDFETAAQKFFKKGLAKTINL